jgi:hypothetical protein
MWGAGSRNGNDHKWVCSAQRTSGTEETKPPAIPCYSKAGNEAEANGQARKFMCDLLPLLGKALRCPSPEKRKSLPFSYTHTRCISMLI